MPDPIEAVKKHLRVTDPSVLLISHSTYSGKTPAEARRLVKIELDKLHFGITPDPISGPRASRQLGGGQIPEAVAGNAISEGVTFVRCYYDGTDNTGKIKHGKPVVFDTVKGWGVTGVNETWQPDEYKILGIALDEYEDEAEEGGRIAVRLIPQQPEVKRRDFVIAMLHGGPSFSGTDGANYGNGFGVYIDGLDTHPYPSLFLPSSQATLYEQKVDRSTDPARLNWRFLGYDRVYNMTPWHFGATAPTCQAIVRQNHEGVWMVERPFGWVPHFTAILGGRSPGRRATFGGVRDFGKLFAIDNGPDSLEPGWSSSLKVLCPGFQTQSGIVDYYSNYAIHYRIKIAHRLPSEGVSGNRVIPSFGVHFSINNSSPIAIGNEFENQFILPLEVTVGSTVAPITPHRNPAFVLTQESNWGGISYDPVVTHSFAGVIERSLSMNWTIGFYIEANGLEYSEDYTQNVGISGEITIFPMFQ